MSTSHHAADASADLVTRGGPDYVVYRLLGEDFRLLYIGCTGALHTRLGNHRTSKPWWSEVVCYSLEHHGSDRVGALDAELAAIRSEQPPYNRREQRRPITERFWEKVDIGSPDECWNWTAATSNGYGLFSISHAQPRTAHSLAYELTFGVRSSKRLTLMHTCDNRRCVNPAHLEVGRPRKTHCKRGHEFTPANTYVIPRTGSRVCIACDRTRHVAYHSRLAQRKLTRP